MSEQNYSVDKLRQLSSAYRETITINFESLILDHAKHAYDIATNLAKERGIVKKTQNLMLTNEMANFFTPEEIVEILISVWHKLDSKFVIDNITITDNKVTYTFSW